MSRGPDGPSWRGLAIRLAVAAVAAHAVWCVLIPAGGRNPVLVELAPGTPAARIAAQLHEAGLIRSPLYFRALARLTRQPLKAGEYGFRRASLWTVLRAIQDGRVYLHRILVKEGDAADQIGEALEREGIADRLRFGRAVADREALNRLGLTAPSAEGYLFPDTYMIPKSFTEPQIVALMVRRFQDALPGDLAERIRAGELDLRKLVILASIVEKEARVPEERPVIAGVYSNRLRKNMLLQADPTVLYALHRWDWKLSRKDLLIDSPYNTYRYKGLPPGPICSPGLACLTAAADPQAVPYLYFVTRKDGTNRHQFSRTLAEHDRAIRASRERAKART